MNVWPTELMNELNRWLVIDRQGMTPQRAGHATTKLNK